MAMAGTNCNWTHEIGIGVCIASLPRRVSKSWYQLIEMANEFTPSHVIEFAFRAVSINGLLLRGIKKSSYDERGTSGPIWYCRQCLLIEALMCDRVHERTLTKESTGHRTAHKDKEGAS